MKHVELAYCNMEEQETRTIVPTVALGSSCSRDIAAVTVITVITVITIIISITPDPTSCTILTITYL